MSGRRDGKKKRSLSGRKGCERGWIAVKRNNRIDRELVARCGSVDGSHLVAILHYNPARFHSAAGLRDVRWFGVRFRCGSRFGEAGRVWYAQFEEISRVWRSVSPDGSIWARNMWVWMR